MFHRQQQRFLTVSFKVYVLSVENESIHLPFTLGLQQVDLEERHVSLKIQTYYRPKH